MPFPGFNYLGASFTPAQQAELEQFVAYLQGYLSHEHKDSGAHANITADSVQIAGPLSATTGTFAGAVSVQDDITISATETGGGGSGASGPGITIKGGEALDHDYALINTSDNYGRGVGLYDVDDGTGILRIYRTGTHAYTISPDEDGVATVKLGDHSDSDLVFDEVATKASYNSGPEVLSGVLTPSQITANQNNYEPTGLSTARVLRLTSDAASTITGLKAQAAGTALTLLNVNGTGSPFTITLKNADTVNSAAANVFVCPSFADYSLVAGDGVNLYYDGVSSVWRIVR